MRCCPCQAARFPELLFRNKARPASPRLCFIHVPSVLHCYGKACFTSMFLPNLHCRMPAKSAMRLGLRQAAQTTVELPAFAQPRGSWAVCRRLCRFWRCLRQSKLLLCNIRQHRDGCRGRPAADALLESAAQPCSRRALLRPTSVAVAGVRAAAGAAAFACDGCCTTSRWPRSHCRRMYQRAAKLAPP